MTLKLGLAAAMVTTTLAWTCSTALASTEFTISRAGAIELASEGKLTFTAGTNRVECNVTFRGNLSGGPIRMAAAARFGNLTGAVWVPCANGSLETFLIETGGPWELLFEAILGTAPDAITGLLFEVRRFKVMFAQIGGAFRCLYEGELGMLVRLARVGAGAYATGRVRVLEPNSLPLLSGAGCPAAVEVKGEFNLRPTQTLTFR